MHNASHLPLWHGGRQKPKVIDVGTQLHEILRLVHFFRESLWCSELRLNISPAEFSRVQPSSARFSRVQPSSAEFSQKPGFEFGRVRPSSKKFQVASRFVLGTRINKQLQAQALSVMKFQILLAALIAPAGGLCVVCRQPTNNNKNRSKAL